MSTSSNILVNIIGEFQKKGFDDADKASKKLGGSFDKLGKKLLAALSVGAITKFAKESLKAFSEDEKAAARLTQTLNSMGLAFEDPRMRQFLANMEAQTGVLDDQLRPAMQRLIQTTGSLTQSQDLLNLALNISRGTGVSLETVAMDLSRAYVGQTRGLTKYNLGLTQAQLKTKTFTDLTELLNKQFAGQNAAYLETYAGKMDILNVAFANAQETIGKGLAEAFTILAGDQGIGSATKAIDEFAQTISDAVVGLADLVSIIQKLPGMGDWTPFSVGNIPIVGAWIEYFASRGEQQRIAPKPFQTGMSVSGASDLYTKQEIARKKAEEAAAKRLRQMEALQKKAAAAALKREREQQALKRAGTVFDMENIQIVAALQAKISEDERLRLNALLAINNKNAEAAEKLSMAVLATNAAAFQSIGVIIQAGDNVDDVIRKLLNAQTNLALVKKGLVEIPKAKNPFEDWPDVMKTILEQIKQISKAVKEVPSLSTNTTTAVGVIPQANSAASTAASLAGTVAGRDSGVIFSPSGTPFIVPKDVTANVFDDPRMFVEGFSNVASNPQLNWQAVGDTFVTNVTVTGSVTSDADLVDMITNEIYKAQKSGKGILLNSVAI